MKFLSLKWLTQRCYLLALAAGFLIAAAFPKLSVAGFAWFAPGLLLFAGIGQKRATAIRIGWVAGLAFHLTALYWLCYMPVTFVPFLAWAALSGYCALYTGLWVWLSWKLFPVRLARDAEGGNFRQRAEQFASVGWLQRMRWAFACAILWVAGEIILGRFLSGFPWLFLGMSQYKLIPLIQISAVTGVYGVSFLVVWFSVALLCAGMALAHRPGVRWAAMAELALPFLVAAAVCAVGLARSLKREAVTETLDVALIQPSVPQTMIWDSKENTNRFNKVVSLTEAALKSKPALVIWPEAAVPNMLRYDEFVGRAITGLAKEHGVWMIVGSDDAEPRKGTTEDDYFNSSFLISPEGRLMERYAKRRLVIFGEFVPLVQWLPFLKHLTPIQGGFTPGEKAVPFTLTNPRVKTAVLICFEDVFGHVAREYVDEDTDFLVNITNDGWFGESAEQWQHAANGVFRAVENGVPLIRCTNNGVTCWVDGNGRMQVYRYGEPPSEYGTGFVTIKMPLLAGKKRELTFYTRHGDWFGWGCVAMAAVMVGLRRKEGQTE